MRHKTIILVFVVALLPIQASAGFITGVVVGAVMTDSNSSPSNNITVVSSDAHDVIMCTKVSDKHKCVTEIYLETREDGTKGYSREKPVEEYAKDAGYTTVHKVSVEANPAGTKHIIFIEGSK